jgi:alpha-beta hydrolase superfamily lysophospholipase
VIFDKAQQANRLVVMLHGYTRTAESLDAVAKAVRKAPGFERSDILRPRLPLGMFSTANLNILAKDVLRRIDEHFTENSHEEICFVGHSVGALLVRKVYVTAQGETSDAPFEPELQGEIARAWAKRVKRIVLLAGMNRGWRISHHLSIRRAIFATLGICVGRVWELLRRRKLLAFQVRRGAPFLTQLRLQWLAMRKALPPLENQSELQDLVTVQLLGSIDDVVSPDDNIDLVSGRHFIYLDVGFTGHLGIIEMDDQDHGAERERQFIKALSASRSDLDAEAVQVSDYRREPDESVKDVIFVVHGIRDAGYWTQKIARRVAKTAGKDRKFAMVTSSYGYFPMAPFLMAAKRREKVEWLMDQYAEAVAYYPKAKFSCVAHSNGTNLIAKALELYPSCRFKHIVFAGSVVRQQYDWRKLLPGTGEGRVKAVANYVATRDLVVAWFPKFFQFLRLQDIGSAGHDGFDEDPLGAVRDETFVKGGHSAALDERNWDAIARFIVTGKFEPVPGLLEARRQAWWVRLFGFFPPAVWIAIIAALAYIAWVIYSHVSNPVVRTLALVIYVWAIWKILTRI